MKQREARSWFSSVPGMLALAALCILTAYFKLHALTVFIFLVLLVMVISFIWGKLSLRNVTVTPKVTSCNVFSGEDLRFKLEISNDKIIPLPWVDVTYFDDAPSFLSQNNDLSHRLAWLMPRQSTTWEAVVHTDKRGVAFMDCVGATSGDGFGLSSQSRLFKLSPVPMLVVYPKVFHVDPTPLADDISSMKPSDRGRIQDNSLFKGIRDYMPGDSTKNINWRVLARQGQLAVNLYQSLEPRQVTLILDLESFTSWRDEVTNSGVTSVLDHMDSRELEDMISLAASCIVELSNKGVHCNLILPSYGNSDFQIVSDSSIQEQTVKSLTALAAIDYSGQRCSFIGLLESMHSFGQTWVLCEHRESDAIKRELMEMNGIGAIVWGEADNATASRILTLNGLRRDNAEA